MLDVSPPIDSDSYHILREEIEAAVKSPKKGKSAGVDNILSGLVRAGGGSIIDTLLIICDKILSDRGVAKTLDSVLDHHSPKEKQLQLCQS